MEFPRTELLPRHTTGIPWDLERNRDVCGGPLYPTRRGLGAATPLRKHVRFDDSFLHPRRITATSSRRRSLALPEEEERDDDFSTIASC